MLTLISYFVRKVITCPSRLFKIKTTCFFQFSNTYGIASQLTIFFETENRSAKMIPTATDVSGCMLTTNFWSPVTIKRRLSVAVLVWSFVISYKDRHEAAFHYGYCH